MDFSFLTKIADFAKTTFKDVAIKVGPALISAAADILIPKVVAAAKSANKSGTSVLKAAEHAAPGIAKALEDAGKRLFADADVASQAWKVGKEFIASALLTGHAWTPAETERWHRLATTHAWGDEFGHAPNVD